METALAPEIAQALKNGAVTHFDDRGLMPLAEARKIVGETEEFRRGKGKEINGQIFWESDIAWAAIMSLENTEEFLKEATRIKWYFHPRGGRDAALVLRYGEGILPWLESFLRPDGHFVNVPWCVKNCLMAIDKPEVFDFLWRIKSFTDGTEGFPGPFAPDNPGDADLRIESHFDAKAPETPDVNADEIVSEWVIAHYATGMNCLSAMVGRDERGRRLFNALK